MYSALWCLFFFFKQKTAYELRISDWSSDVCSSDLLCRGRLLEHARRRGVRLHDQHTARALLPSGTQHHRGPCPCRAVRGLWLPGAGLHPAGAALYPAACRVQRTADADRLLGDERRAGADDLPDRQSVVEGQRVSVRLDIGGPCINKTKQYTDYNIAVR